jgi:hypothetical protein
VRAPSGPHTPVDRFEQSAATAIVTPDAAETPDLAGAAAVIASRKKTGDHRLNSKT